jgi:hypothetical protein
VVEAERLRDLRRIGDRVEAPFASLDLCHCGMVNAQQFSQLNLGEAVQFAHKSDARANGLIGAVGDR